MLQNGFCHKWRSWIENDSLQVAQAIFDEEVEQMLEKWVSGVFKRIVWIVEKCVEGGVQEESILKERYKYYASNKEYLQYIFICQFPEPSDPTLNKLQRFYNVKALINKLALYEYINKCPIINPY